MCNVQNKNRNKHKRLSSVMRLNRLASAISYSPSHSNLGFVFMFPKLDCRVSGILVVIRFSFIVPLILGFRTSFMWIARVQTEQCPQGVELLKVISVEQVISAVHELNIPLGLLYVQVQR